MKFNSSKFDKAAFTFREAVTSFPAMKEFFDGDEVPVFKSRGLSGTELAQAQSDAKRGRLITETLVQMNSSSEVEKIKAMLEELGIQDDDPPEVAQQISHIEFGLVEPELTRAQVVKLVKYFPVDMKIIHAKIMELSGQGAAAEVKP